MEHLHTEFTKVYSVHELCEALDVARGTFYNHIFRRADRSKYESEQAQLALKVKQIFDDSEQRYGAEKIRTILISNGLHVSKKHISAIMQELGLHSVRTDAKKLYKAQQRKSKTSLIVSFVLIIQIIFG
ncbi:MAG: IS3 family transposase [Dysosmobacter sp.]